jgi:hypothetical protein
MAEMNEPELFKNPCGVCRKKVATRLCDFIIDYHGVIFFRDFQDFRDQERHETCDLPMCEDCATKHAGHDFCPYHLKLYDRLQLTDEKQLRAQRDQKMKPLIWEMEKGDG